MTPFVSDPDFTLYVGDVREVLRDLPDESVHCVVTSPPYWGLRDYGTGSWEGGDPACDHQQETRHQAQGSTSQRQGRSNVDEQRNETFRSVCGKCGAVRIDRQLGLEATPEEYVARMVEVFREVRRVLRCDGVCWLNIGDSYNAYNGNRGPSGSISAAADVARNETPHGLTTDALKPKDLIGMPWRVAFALQADGWYLRSDIIWAKPNPMPESVTDRPTKAHEYLFLLTRSARYFYDADAIREPAEWARWGDQTNGKHEGSESAAGWIGSKPKEQLQGGRQARRYSAEKFKTTDERNTRYQGPNPADGGRNARSVWEIATQPYAEAHFATFPEELPRRCIAAGCPEDGVVLDPFIGSGTTALVARRLNRCTVGVELNPDYAALAAKRLSQQSLLAAIAEEERG